MLRLLSLALCGLPMLAAGLPAEARAKIETLFRECDKPDVPGASVMVIRGGEVLFERGYGFADVESRVRSTPRTNYRLASVTKQFTAMAVMMLAERGSLGYERKLREFIPELPAWAERITLRQMLNHTSGLPAYEDDAPEIPPEKVTPAVQLQDKDVVEILKKRERLLFEPGSEYRYSNSGYVLLGVIVERVAGVPLREFLAANIFRPLGMQNTVMHQEGITKVAYRAYGHSKRGEKFVRTDQSSTSATLGDGAIYSSVEDLRKWDAALTAGRFVRAATWREAVTPAKLTNGKPTEYGFGWDLKTRNGKRVWQHSGSSMGFENFIARYPDDGLTVIVLMNRTDLSPRKITESIAEIVLE